MVCVSADGPESYPLRPHVCRSESSLATRRLALRKAFFDSEPAARRFPLACGTDCNLARARQALTTLNIPVFAPMFLGQVFALTTVRRRYSQCGRPHDVAEERVGTECL